MRFTNNFLNQHVQITFENLQVILEAVINNLNNLAFYVNTFSIVNDALNIVYVFTN